MRRRALRLLAAAAGLAAVLVLFAHPSALAGSDLWSNVAPASPLGSGGLFNRYPLDHYGLDQPPWVQYVTQLGRPSIAHATSAVWCLQRCVKSACVRCSWMT